MHRRGGRCTIGASVVFFALATSQSGTRVDKAAELGTRLALSQTDTHSDRVKAINSNLSARACKTICSGAPATEYVFITDV